MKKREIQLIYNSDDETDRASYATAKALPNYIINELDLKHNTLTEKQLKELAESAGKSVSELFDTKSEDYSDQFKSLSEQDQLLMLHKNIKLLKTPIVREKGGATFILTSSFNLYPVDLDVEVQDKSITG
ncbi:hypothetical protein FNH22_05610 [Fulvivirga sp. M361]|uniref:arsenate reductase family protein n=1 Tax=Fulvivirga sp. M361 TaxID=2594266 RepID=UPI001179C888|nr:hypothetical protein [Fulvivirga sp. M361]TRX60526.1 hypothetical protein FNH22_05610 [Fulvivirga sp. M361]